MSNQSMLAARFHEFGGLDRLVLEQVSRPQPQPDQVLIRMIAAGVNPADWKMRAGYFQAFMPLPLPWTSGLDGAGIIVAVGKDVAVFQPGQSVFGFVTGGYAEYAVAADDEVQLKPAHLTFEQAASVPLGSLTAWQAVIEEADIQAGQHVLVQGGAGGVGLYAVQLARWKGAHVAATTSAANVDFVRSLGAETVINYQTTKFEDKVHGLDAVIDTVGGDLIERSLHVVKPGGIFVTVAGMVDAEAAQTRGVRAINGRRADAVNLQQVSQLLESGKLIPEVGQIFPLAQARQAQELSQTGHGRGRIVLLTA
jgi:NADPH:quinone reductase-like Zn-dependent oxidoreductase